MTKIEEWTLVFSTRQDLDETGSMLNVPDQTIRPDSFRLGEIPRISVSLFIRPRWELPFHISVVKLHFDWTLVGWSRSWLCFFPVTTTTHTKLQQEGKGLHVWHLVSSWWVSGLCLEGVWKVSEGCLDGVLNVSGRCP